MNRFCWTLVGSCLLAAPLPAQHPSIFITKAEGAQIRASATRYPLLAHSLDEAKATMTAAFAKPIDVPQP